MAAQPIPSLKIKDGKLYYSDENGSEWNEASVSLIPAIESLYSRLLKTNFPEVSRREVIILADQYNVVDGKVKAYKDEDGDMQMTFVAGQEEDIVFDEDADFDHFQTSIPKRETEPENYWEVELSPAKVAYGGKPRDDIISIDSDDVIDISTKQLYDSFETPKKLKIAVKVNERRESPFRKRNTPALKPPRVVEFDTLKQILRDSSSKRDPPSSDYPSPLSSNLRPEFVSFMTKRYSKTRKSQDPGLLLGEIRYNRRIKKEGTLESNFYLFENVS